MANGPRATSKAITSLSQLTQIARKRQIAYLRDCQQVDVAMPMNKTFWGDYFGMWG